MKDKRRNCFGTADHRESEDEDEDEEDQTETAPAISHHGTFKAFANSKWSARMTKKTKKPSSRKKKKKSTLLDKVARARLIHEALQGGDCLSGRALAEEIGTTPRTIQRDVAWMIKRGIPVVFDYQIHAYRYTKKDVDFGDLELMDSEIISLYLSGYFAQTLRGTANESSFASGHAKLRAALQKMTSLDLSKFPEYISLATAGQERNPDTAVARAIRTAIMLSKEISFTYRKSDGSERERVVQPHHLRRVDGLWYLICHDLEKLDLITYMQKRMARVERTGNKFERRYTLERIHEEFRHSLGIYSGKNPVTVRLRFTGFAAEYVPLKTWHASEEFSAPQPNGSVILTMQLALNPEVKRFVQQWGDEVLVLEPPALVEQMRATVSKLRAIYPVEGDAEG